MIFLCLRDVLFLHAHALKKHFWLYGIKLLVLLFCLFIVVASAYWYVSALISTYFVVAVSKPMNIPLVSCTVRVYLSSARSSLKCSTCICYRCMYCVYIAARWWNMPSSCSNVSAWSITRWSNICDSAYCIIIHWKKLIKSNWPLILLFNQLIH